MTTIEKKECPNCKELVYHVIHDVENKKYFCYYCMLDDDE